MDWDERTDAEIDTALVVAFFAGVEAAKNGQTLSETMCEKHAALSAHALAFCERHLGGAQA